LNPYEGGKIAIAEAVRNVVCSGAAPLASTDCLNFGNPMIPEVFYMMKECVRGLSDACKAFDTPVTGGNVSLYNQNPEGSIYPTPIVGIVGVIDYKDDNLLELINTQDFKNKDDVIVLLGKTKDELGGSEFLNVIFDEEIGDAPNIDLAHEQKLYDVILCATREKLLSSCHDCSCGGLAVTLAESCISNKGQQIGAVIKIKENLEFNSLLFSETQSRAVVSLKQENLEKLESICKANNFPYEVIGKTGGDKLLINDKIDISVKDMDDVWRNSLEENLKVK